MNLAANFSGISQFLLKYWFRLTVISFLIYIFFKKDLTFQVNLRAPEYREEELLAETADKPSMKTKATIGGEEQFNLNFVGGEAENIAAAKELAKTEEKAIYDYLKRFAHVAVSERKKYGIPSSIILASGLLHSVAGRREIALRGYNHFALTCENWEGERLSAEKNCFRKYANAWSSYRDFSLTLTSGKHLNIRQSDGKNYQKWAKAIEQSGFFQEPNLAQKLIELIERYQLYELDSK